jgi:nucleoside-diphosphate-sugar epimerase
MTMSRDRILVTGATGIVGCEIVRDFLRLPDPPEIVAVVRGKPAEVEAKSRWLRAWCGLDAKADSRLFILGGDITQPGLGLSPTHRVLARTVTGIIHAGAVTRFDQAADAAFVNNVGSTRSVLEHARVCPRIERVGLVSTAFVAGRRRGTIFEDELDLGTEFNNEYERSKALAENEARERMRALPISIYRLSIVTGRSTDGGISRFSGLYPILRLYHQGLLAMFPADDGQRIDLIPADFAAAAVHHLFTTAFVPGQTYHVCAGEGGSFALDDLFPAIDEYIAAVDPEWRRRGQALPLPVSADVFRDFVDVVELTGNKRLRQIIGQVTTVTRQLEVPKTFDTRAFQAAAAGVRSLALPHAREWLGASVARAIAAKWQQPARFAPMTNGAACA